MDGPPEGSGGRRPTPLWQARIKNRRGDVLGAGVLVTERHVVTCAHVLNDKANATDPAPTETFDVDFPRAAGPSSRTATVVRGGWFPRLDDRRDVAILEFDQPLPRGLDPARLSDGRSSGGNSVRVLGYPGDLDTGFWSSGRVEDTVGPYGERVQVSGDPTTPNGRIEPGYSGGGVIDESTGRVIGIIVTAYLRTERYAAFMIPIQAIGDLWQPLRDLIEEPAAAQDLLGREVLDAIAVELGRVNRLDSQADRRRIVALLPGIVQELLRDPATVTELVDACRRRPHMRLLLDLARYFQGRDGWPASLDELAELHRLGSADTSARRPDWTERGRAELRAALLLFPDFRNAESRHLLLDLFGLRVWERHNERIRFDKSDDVAEDVAALIRACQPIVGSLQLVVETFAVGYQGRPELRRLLTVVQALDRRSLLTAAERGRLVTALSRTPENLLTEAHRRAEPPLRTGDRPPREIAPLVRHLESYLHDPATLPPIFTFVEYVATRTTDRASGSALRDWTDQVAARLRHAHDDVRTLRAGLADLRVRPRDPVLAIEITPDALEPNVRYVVAAAIQHDGQQEMVSAPDEPLTVPQIVVWLHDLLGLVYERLDFETDDLVVEVVVPRSLITEPVDQWSVAAELASLGEPLGAGLAIVLRSYERLRQRDLRPPWREKWRTAQDQRQPSAETMHFVPHGDPATARQVASELRLAKKLILVLGGPPEQRPELASPYDAYAAALSAGIPYIAWVRNPALENAFKLRVTKALTEGPVRELPGVVSSWRSNRHVRDDETRKLGEVVTIFVCDETRPIQLSPDLGPPVKG